MLQKINISLLFIFIIILGSTCYAVESLSYSNIVTPSDFDVEYFIDNSLLPQVSANTEEVLETLKNNDYVQAFQELCDSDEYLYITILSHATNEWTSSSRQKYMNSSYSLILSKSQLYIDSTSTSSSINYYRVRSSNDSMVVLTLNWNANGALNTEYTSTLSFNNKMSAPWKLTTSYSTGTSYNAGFYFSTCGIASSKGSSSYASFFGTMAPNTINYETYPILEEYNPNPYFVLDEIFDSTVELVTRDDTVYTIKSTSNFDVSKPVGRIYAKNPTLIKYVELHQTVRNSNGSYSFSNGNTFLLYSRDELVNGTQYGYLVPVAPGGVFSYFDVYLPSSIITKDAFYQIDLHNDFGSLWFDFEASSFFINSNAGIIGAISGDLIPSGDNFTLEDSTNSIIGKIEETKQGLIDGLLNGLKSLFVPTEEQMSEWLTKTQADITDKLGVLGEPVNFFSTLMNKLLLGNSEDFIFHIPELIIPGTEYKLLDSFDINFTQMINEHEAFKTIYDRIYSNNIRCNGLLLL